MVWLDMPGHEDPEYVILNVSAVSVRKTAMQSIGDTFFCSVEGGNDGNRFSLGCCVTDDPEGGSE
jgi:hypothetical protein